MEKVKIFEVVYKHAGKEVFSYCLADSLEDAEDLVSELMRKDLIAIRCICKNPLRFVR